MSNDIETITVDLCSRQIVIAGHLVSVPFHTQNEEAYSRDLLQEVKELIVNETAEIKTIVIFYNYKTTEFHVFMQTAKEARILKYKRWFKRA